jgi:uncharacterized membrane protein
MDREPGRRGDERWVPSLVVAVVIVIPLLVPIPESRWTAWVVMLLGLPLLVAVVLFDPGRVDRRSSALRVLTLMLTGLLVVGSAVAAVRLISELLRGAPDLQDADALLWAGFLVWINANLTFALLFWELDSGGPAERLLAPRPHPDLAFVQHVNPDLAPPGWMPTFPDYLYLGFTNALAFSPTDTMPLSHWAKFTMAVQSLVSVAILSLVVANAVNALG